MVRPLSAILVFLLAIAGCSGSEPESDAPSPAGSGRPQAVSLVPFNSGTATQKQTTLQGCAGVRDEQDAGYTRTILIWVRLRVTAGVRLLPASYAKRSNSIDSVTQYVGADPGPEAPHLAISIGEAGTGPTDTRDLLRHDTHLIGDRRDSAAGLAGAQTSWAARAPLGTRGVRLARGDHYLFVEVDPAKGGMDLHKLTANWRTTDGEDHVEIGDLSIRQQCGG
jgi:hypothetical protein